MMAYLIIGVLLEFLVGYRIVTKVGHFMGGSMFPRYHKGSICSETYEDLKREEKQIDRQYNETILLLRRREADVWDEMQPEDEEQIRLSKALEGEAGSSEVLGRESQLYGENEEERDGAAYQKHTIRFQDDKR